MKKSYIIAAVLTLALTAWVLGGYFLRTVGKEADGTTPVADAAPTMRVAVRTQEAKPVSQIVVAQGQAEPNRTVTVRAETLGQIAEILADEGSTVAAGDVIARLEPNAREARIERAKARLREQESAYEAAQALGKKGYQTQRQSDQIYSSLQTAKHELEVAMIEQERLDIKAPFEGEVLTVPIELGAYVDVNGEVATIVDNHPLVVSVQITQQDITDLKVGQKATVTFATGQKGEGKIRYIAARADEGTRTFRVEIELPNPDGAIPSGISAEARIPTGSVMAQFVSPADLSLNEAGKLGVKTVGKDSRVVFHEASIVMSDASGAWVIGLPPQARIITLGHGYVQIGEQVQVAEEQGSTGMDGSKEAAARLTTRRVDEPTAAQ
ncbi:MAG: efflux RND transporter periplasmic adaptor subunit [Methyloceanibacter sp.]|uniref:efflux RND transporter periplasmic adaptor subunit n=1 Tax=Methyloceanibacter sp. TaxID=1965321 RepID=UPI0035612B23